MTRNTAVWFLLASAALAAAGGCGRTERSTGSNTNWLTQCSADVDCPGESACWCHVCAAACTTGADCHGSTCQATTGVGCGEPSSSAQVCVVECETSAECRDRGPGIECNNGVCLPPSVDGASGADGASGGEAGDSGAPGGGHGGSSSAGSSSSGTAGQGATGPGGSGTGGVGGGMGGMATSGAAGQAGASPVGPLGPMSRRIGVSLDHSCVVSGGQVYCWGGNYKGENGVTPSSDSPVQAVPGVDDAVGVAVSNSHACALTSSGDVYCWGSNTSGQSGPTSAPNGTCVDQDISFDPCQPNATHIDGVEHVVDLAVESEGSCALIDDGSAVCWGGSEALSRWTTQFSGATSITSGSSGMCAILADGGIACSYPPPEFANLTGIQGLALNNGTYTSGYDFSCALGPSGEVSCSGNDSFGQLGDDNGALANALPSGMQSLVAGHVHACALDADGQAWCWGANTDGAVGTYPLASYSCPGGTDEPAPRLVEGVPPLVAIAAGDSTTCGFAADDTLWCWGSGTPGGGVVGPPVRVPGPWESGGETCSAAVAFIDSSQLVTDTNCTIDADCVAVPLDLSCDHTCKSASVPVLGAQAFVDTLNQLESDTCGAARDAGCLSPAITCPDEPLRAVCVEQHCTLDNPSRTGCTDECACNLQRNAQPVQTAPLCDGYELAIETNGTCAHCDGSWVYVVIGNEGGSPFSGHATLSFSVLGAPSAPAPMDVALSLGPGEVSVPIRVDAAVPGTVQATVVASDNCYDVELSSILDFPDSATTCP